MKNNKLGLRFLAISALALVLGACGSAGSVDYQDVPTGKVITVPPSVGGGNSSPVYVVPPIQKGTVAAGDRLSSPQFLQGQDAPIMTVHTLGGNVWLELLQDRAQVGQNLLAYFKKLGVNVDVNNLTSVITTQWLNTLPPGYAGENLKLPAGASVRFVLQTQVNGDNTDVFFNTQVAKKQGGKYVPVPGNFDPLNRQLLLSWMVYLGASPDFAQQQITTVLDAPVAGNSQVHFAANGALYVADTPAHTWQRLYGVIQNAGFSIKNSSAQKGTFTILYLDTDNGEKRQGANAISRLFGDNGNLTPLPYIIQIKSDGKGHSMVTVAPGGSDTPDSQDTYRRILTVFLQKLQLQQLDQ